MGGGGQLPPAHIEVQVVTFHLLFERLEAAVHFADCVQPFLVGVEVKFCAPRSHFRVAGAVYYQPVTDETV